MALNREDIRRIFKTLQKERPQEEIDQLIKLTSQIVQTLGGAQGVYYDETSQIYPFLIDDYQDSY